MTLLTTIAEIVVTTLDTTVLGPVLVGKKFSVAKLLWYLAFAAVMIGGAISGRSLISRGEFWLLGIIGIIFALGAVVQFAGLTWERDHKQKHQDYEIPAWLETLSWFVWPDVHSWLWLRRQFPAQTAGAAIGFFAFAMVLGVWLFNEIWPGWLLWIGIAIVVMTWLFAGYCTWESRQKRSNEPT